MVTRRTILATTALAAATLGIPAARASAQEATPDPATDGVGNAIARVRGIATAQLAEVVYADALTHFLPLNREIDGYHGYVFAFVNDDPTGQMTLSLLADEAAAEASAEVSKEFVAGLDPRFEVELRNEFAGRMRVWAVTERTRMELPPSLAGCAVTFRDRTNAEGADMERVFSLAATDLVPQLTVMEGFIMYGLLQTETGRTGISVWETAAQMEAGNALIANFVQQTQQGTWVGDAVICDGTIGYAELVRLQ